MNKLFFLITFFCFSFSVARSQKIEKYFQVSTFFKNRGIQVNIDFGKDSTLFAFKDESIKQKIVLAVKYSTTVDVLNYITSLGWTVQNPLATLPEEGIIGYTFFFKRTFDVSELK